MLPRFSTSSPAHTHTTPIAQYDVPYEPPPPLDLRRPSTPSERTNSLTGDIRSKYSLLHAAHRDLQRRYDALRTENEVLSQRLQVTMVVSSSMPDNNSMTSAAAAAASASVPSSPSKPPTRTVQGSATVTTSSLPHHKSSAPLPDSQQQQQQQQQQQKTNQFVLQTNVDRLVNDVVSCARDLYRQRIWQDVEIIRSQPDYVQDYFCFFCDEDTRVCNAGSFVICEDYVCFVYSETGRTTMVLPIANIARVSVAILPLDTSNAHAHTTYEFESTLCMDVVLNTKRHFQFFGFSDIEAVILSLQGSYKTPVNREWERGNGGGGGGGGGSGSDLDNVDMTRVPKDHREMYRREVLEVEKELWTRITGSSSWPVVANNKEGIEVRSITPRDEPVVYRVSAIIDALPREVWAAYYDLEQRIQWDPLLRPTSRVVDRIDDRTDVVYSCVAGTVKGFVSARDYIDIRRWIPQIDGQSILLVWRGVAWYPGVETEENCVRGQNHTCGVLFQPVLERHHAASVASANTPSCRVTMIMQTQANGWLPQSVVDKATLKFMFDVVHRLRAYLSSTNELDNTTTTNNNKT